tara:strand:+ start:13624 stop:13842 length:219 start_codon:yes stop_codon:yes gene_type:complete
MFTEADFVLPLEKELRLQVIKTEIDDCADINMVKEQLKSCAESLMKYQHLLTKAVEINLMGYLEAFDNQHIT